MLGESLTHCVSGARKTVHERVNGTKETSGACIPNMFIPVRGSFLSSRRPLLFRNLESFAILLFGFRRGNRQKWQYCVQ